MSTPLNYFGKIVFHLWLFGKKKLLHNLYWKNFETKDLIRPLNAKFVRKEKWQWKTRLTMRDSNATLKKQDTANTLFLSSPNMVFTHLFYILGTGSSNITTKMCAGSRRPNGLMFRNNSVNICEESFRSKNFILTQCQDFRSRSRFR